MWKGLIEAANGRSSSRGKSQINRLKRAKQEGAVAEEFELELSAASVTSNSSGSRATPPKLSSRASRFPWFGGTSLEVPSGASGARRGLVPELSTIQAAANIMS